MIEAKIRIGGLELHVRDGELQICDPDQVLDPQNTPGPMMSSESLETAIGKLRFLHTAAKQHLAQEANE